MIDLRRLLVLLAMSATILATEGRAQVTIDEEEEIISALLDKTVPVEKCPINQQVYSALDGEYQKFQFLTGTAGGTVQFSEYRNGKLAWTAAGEFGCSNGVVICGIDLTVKAGEAISVGYEEFRTLDGEQYIVFSHLRETAFRRELNGVGGEGLKVELKNGFKPTADDVLIPVNVYRYSNCKK
ncbi:MAG: hypothetical protein EOS23_26360 [Mesorhizobium sp.]|nr:hypothetical protein [Mesorhizobium sp.]RWE07650.1 MAG: hypothetical protein EOS23_26360 [Mesorhizobium sp.]RWE91079.1 MAG: hypothetical protein EOS43_33270 [Mesorhizobium sp.]RWP55873.1 MAG: hypothetical protein EOR07_33015 [Mesorhizobium sp.]